MTTVKSTRLSPALDGTSTKKPTSKLLKAGVTTLSDQFWKSSDTRKPPTSQLHILVPCALTNLSAKMPSQKMSRPGTVFSCSSRRWKNSASLKIDPKERNIGDFQVTKSREVLRLLISILMKFAPTVTVDKVDALPAKAESVLKALEEEFQDNTVASLRTVL
eukprot:UN27204